MRPSLRPFVLAPFVVLVAFGCSSQVSSGADSCPSGQERLCGEGECQCYVRCDTDDACAAKECCDAPLDKNPVKVCVSEATCAAREAGAK